MINLNLSQQTPPCRTAGKSVRVRDLAMLFLRVGATGFGGMPALAAMVHEQVVERKKWVTPDEFAEAMAVGQILPGPIVVDAVTYIGHRLRGWIGAMVAAGSLIAPPFVLMLGLTPLYFRYGHLPRLDGAFRGIGAAVVALIAAACYRLAKPSMRDVPSAVIAIAAFAALAQFQADPIVVLLGSGALGMLIWRKAEGKGKTS